ncbi:MAG: hypothetical protein LBL78_06135 [Prevotellaceae bacterium]|jgi:hypothetical protein|nr:hypothetical protein [Prevotellaceae bacterium]
MRLYLVLLISGWFSILPAQAAGEYRSLIAYADGFAGVGATHIDRLSPEGRVVQSAPLPDAAALTCLAADASASAVLAAGGKRGTLYVCTDTTWAFRPLDTGIRDDIRALAFYQGVLIAAAGSNLLLLDGDGVLGGLQLPVRGNVVALSATAAACYGVTDAGEIVHTTDGTRWTTLDFNATYRGYYPPCTFTDVCATRQRTAVAGTTRDGKPVVYFSEQGTVWYERELTYPDEVAAATLLASRPNVLTYDFLRDIFILGCDDGRVMYLPSCSHCNECYLLPGAPRVTGIAVNRGRVMIVGTDGFSLNL